MAAQKKGAAPTQRIVVFRKGVRPEQRLGIIKQIKGTVVHDLRLIRAVAVKFPPSLAKAGEAQLLANKDVLRVENDYPQKWIEAAPSSLHDVELPRIGDVIRPYTLKDPELFEGEPEIPWGVGRVNAPAAWASSKGAKVKVAVIDTGIDVSHPDLKANIKGGWNAVKSNSDNFSDDNGHGTHCSGIVAALQDGKGVAGVAPEAELYGVKVLNADGSGTFADVIAGIQWAADNKMDIASMSLGAYQGTPALAEAVKAASKAGVTIIAAAGNSGAAVGYPAAYPEVIAVSASNNKDQLATFSSRGPEVAFIAPGVAVRSTYMGGQYRDLSGTSMACPHVSGLAALAVAAKGVHGAEAIRGALKAAAVPLPNLKPEEQGAGLVDASKLVQ